MFYNILLKYANPLASAYDCVTEYGVDRLRRLSYSPRTLHEKLDEGISGIKNSFDYKLNKFTF